MVLLMQKIDKMFSKLENYHHHNHNNQSQPLSVSLEAFKTHVSNSLNKLSLSSKSAESEIPSFSWIQQCFELIPIINNAFSKLVVAIDYPITKWAAPSVDEYLKYSLSLLELCNSMSSSLSHLGKSKLSLAHGLSLVENSSPSLALQHLKPIQTKGLIIKEFRFQGNEETGKGRGLNLISKGKVVHQALVIMEGLVFWVSGILKPGLSGAREVKEVNEAVAGLVAAIETGKSIHEAAAAERLKRRLDVFEKFVEGLGKEVDCLFNKGLAGRNQLINGLQQKNQ